MEELSSGRIAELFSAITTAADNANISLSIFYVEEDDFRFVFVNDGTTKMTGYSIEEIEVRSVWGFFPEDELPRIADMHRLRLAGEPTPDHLESVIVHKDGRRIPVEIATTRITLDGKPANATFLFDISHRREAEQALRESEDRFRSLIESAPDGVVIIRWPEILFVNPKAAHMFGARDPKDVIGTRITDQIRPAELEKAALRAAKRASGEPIKEAESERYVSLDPDGNRIEIEVSTIPIEYEGEPAVLGFARDVTEQNAIRDKLIEADKLAAIGSLAAGVAHEINNPLAYMLLNLEYLERELPRLQVEGDKLPKMVERVQDVRQGAERVRSIVSDLQSFTRRDENIRGPVDLAAVIDTSVQLAGHNIRKSARFVREIQEVPPVYGNTTRLEQLFLNLLVNAVHATAEGPEQSLIEVRVAPGPRGYVEATVRDTGCGMSEDTLNHAFDPFFTTKPAGVGTGLGLSTCLRIVNAVGGEIRLQSKVGEGTTVSLLLKEYTGDEVSGELPLPPSRGS